VKHRRNAGDAFAACGRIAHLGKAAFLNAATLKPPVFRYPSRSHPGAEN
jgi:hypothetical protein